MAQIRRWIRREGRLGGSLRGERTGNKLSPAARRDSKSERERVSRMRGYKEKDKSDGEREGQDEWWTESQRE